MWMTLALLRIHSSISLPGYNQRGDISIPLTQYIQPLAYFDCDLEAVS